MLFPSCLSTHHKAIKHVFIIELIEMFTEKNMKRLSSGEYKKPAKWVKLSEEAKKNLVVFIGDDEFSSL